MKTVLKHKFTKLLSLALAFVIILNVAAPMFSAEEQNILGARDETVYVQLNNDGSVKNVSAVIRLDILGAGKYADDGSYADVVNLTDATVFELSDEGVEWAFAGPVQNFFYQVSLKDYELPNVVSITYYLDGKQVSDIKGVTGKLEMVIEVKPNKNAANYFKNNFMCQIQAPISTEHAKNLSFGKSNSTLAGSVRTVLMQVLPGESGKFSIKADVENFEFDGFTFALIDYDIASAMNMDEYKTGIRDMQNGVVKLIDGTQMLKNGALGLQEGLQPLRTGMGGLQGGLEQLANSLSPSSLNVGTAAIQAGLITAGTEIGEAAVNVGTALITQQGVIAYLQANGADQAIIDGAGAVASSLQAALADIQAAGVAITDTGTAFAALGSALNGLGASLAQLQPGVAALAQVAKQINDGLTAYNDGLSKYIGGFDPLISGQRELLDGIVKFNRELNSMGGSGYKQISFTGKNEINTVQFVMKTDAIEVEAVKITPPVVEDPDYTFVEKILNLFYKD